MLDHTAHVSGAEHSMLTLLDGLLERLELVLACPSGGALERLARTHGLRPQAIAPTEGGLRLHPTQTPRALAQFVLAAAQTAKLMRRARIDLVHANSIRAGLVALGAARLLRRPVVVHIRDVLPRGAVSDATLRLIGRNADAVIAISDHVAQRFSEVAPGTAIETIHNPVDLRRFDPDSIDRLAVRRSLGVDPAAPLLGVVGQITPWKGQLEAVQILLHLRRAQPAAHLIVVGTVKFTGATTRFDNAAYLRELKSFVARTGLDDHVSLLGERADIPELMAACDVLMVPSWSEPFGRVIVEAMAMATLVAATDQGGPREIITDGADGLLMAPREPALWAESLARLLEQPDRMAQIAEAGRRRAADFGMARHAAGVHAVYERLLGATADGALGS